MKHKLLRTFAALLLAVLLIGSLPVYADTSRAQGYIDGILGYNMQAVGAPSVQEWIDGALTDNADTSEWYALTLSQYADYDFSSYRAALERYLSENTVSSAPSRLKYALTLISCGSSAEYISWTLGDSIGRQGIMSWVYGMHLINNGCSSDGYTAGDIKDKLLSLQLADGGWAISGSSGDIDVTAMTVQALAPYYSSDSAVKTAIDKALALLSARQKPSGDYASYGVNNSQSTAQVLVALCALDIDCDTDARFIKNGNTLFDAIEQYRLTDGSFSHTVGGAVSSSATVQVFYSMVSYLRMKKGDAPFYCLDKKDEVQPAVNYKPWLCLALLLIAVSVCAVLAVKKRLGINNLAVIAALTVAAVLLVLFTDIKSADEHYNTQVTKTDVIGTVTVTIRCDSIADKGEPHIPSGGVILDVTEVDISEGDTVLDILSEVSAANKLHLETSGSEYVEGINNIYELDFGDLSGWVYYVNGERPSVSCGAYTLKDGDEIRWVYTLTLGDDT